MIKKLEQEQIDSIADIIWWLKGYMATMLMTEHVCDIQWWHVEALTAARAMALAFNDKDEKKCPSRPNL